MTPETPEEFIRARQADWARLEILAHRAVRGRLVDLPPAEIEALGRLYRQATADLARAQRDYPTDRVTVYLNRLVAQSYPAIYRGGGGWNGRRLVTFYTTDFPRLVRKQWAYCALAAALLFLPAIAAWIAVVVQPGTAALLLPAQVYDKVQGFLERHDLWTHIPVQERPYASTAIMTNNIQVTFLAFAGGLLLGVLTVAVLVLNGIDLGAVAGMCQVYGASLDLWSFVFPHGFIELTVICLGGGAGLRLADAILRPGMQARATSLREAALEAVQMLLGGAGLLVIAGTIEGNISPSDTPVWFRLGFGVVMGLLLYVYLIFAGRRGPGSGTRDPGPGIADAPSAPGWGCSVVVTDEEIAPILQRLAAVPARLAAAFAQFESAAAVLHVPPGAWTPPEVLAHLRAAHDILEPRILAMLARDNPPLPAYDEARWQAAGRYLSLPVTESLETLRLRRRELVHALRGLAPADWARNGVHEVAGPVTVLAVAQAIAAHDEEHCRQLEGSF